MITSTIQATRQGGSLCELVRESNRPAGPLVPASDQAAVQGKPPGEGYIHRTWAHAKPSEHQMSRLSSGRPIDDITTMEQVSTRKHTLGTSKDKIVKKLVPGGHIGLFMGARTLTEAWPTVAEWIGAQ